MPYSITTKDGITISGIPDDLPHDDPSLKQRVASIRSQGGQGGGIPTPTAAPQSTPAPAAPPVTATTNGYMMGLRDPIDAGAQLLEHIMPDAVSTRVNALNNWLADKTGLVSKVAEGPQGTSKMVQAVNKAYDEGRVQRAQGLSNLVTGQKAEPGFDWGRLAGNIINPVNLLGPEVSGPGLIPLAASGARAGIFAAAEQPVLNDNNGQDFWAKKVEQAGLGALSGGIATPIVSRAAGAVGTAVKRTVGAVQQRVAPPQVTPGAVQQAVSDALDAHGMRLEDAPPVILQSVQRQAEEALQSGQKLDPVAAMRKAQFEAVGLTGDSAPTLGQVTRDPMQYANERNLVGVQVQTPTGMGNPLSQRFQNQANTMQGVFDRAGATGATDANSAGKTFIDALLGTDAPVKAGVDANYAAARAMNGGRTAELERGTFSQAANQALDSEMLGHALPGDVRSLLNDITSGKTPFNVDAATQIDTILSRAQRRVQSGQQPDLSAAMAIGKIRDALHATPLVADGAAPAAAAATNGVEDAVMTGGAPQLSGPAVDRTLPAVTNGNQVGQVLQNGGATAATPGIEDTGANARTAFEQARRSARDRFATIESTPALKAALDDAAPDKFVQKFLLGADVRDVQAMHNVLKNSPEALQQARAQIAATLKRAAFGNNASGDGGMTAERYLNTLNSLGPEKLKVFFSPEEIVQFNLAGKAMSDITSIPAGARGAVNHSGTAGAIMNLFSKIAASPTLRRIPVVRNVANAVGEIPTERAMSKALAGQAVAPNPGAELSPEAMRAIRLLFAPAAVGSGALAGQAAQ